MSHVELVRISAERNPVAVLWYEPRRPRGVTLIAGHGYSSSKQNLDFLCSFLAAHGFGVYSLDFGRLAEFVRTLGLGLAPERIGDSST